MKIVTLLLLFIMVVYCDIHAQTPILFKPNGGEKLNEGGTYTITWGGVILPGDISSLDYSTNSGNEWLPIVGNLIGTSYQWNPIPNTPSNTCKVRLTVQRKTNKTDTIVSYQPAIGAESGSGRLAEFNSDASSILTCDDDGWVREYDVVTKNILWQKQLCGNKSTGDFRNYIMNARYNKQGTTVAVYTAEDSIILLNAKTGTEIRRWHNTVVSFPSRITDRSCSFNPDGSILAVSTYQKLRLYNVSDGSFIRETPISDGGINVIEWSKDGQFLAAGTAGFRVYIIDPNTGIPIRDFLTSGALESLEFSPDASLIATTSRSFAQVEVWNVNDGSNKFRNPLFNPVSSCYVLFSRDGNSIFTTGERIAGNIYTVIERSITDGAIIKYRGYARAGLGKITSTPDEIKFCCASSQGAVVLQPSTGGNTVFTDISDGDFSIIKSQVPKDTVELYVPNIRCDAGEIIEIPVKLRGGGKVNAEGISVTLLVNPSLIFPLGIQSGIRAHDNKREINLILPNEANSDSTLLILKCQTMLSTDTISGLTLENPQPINGTTFITTVNGELKTNICREGGARLFDGSKILNLQIEGGDIVNSAIVKGSFSCIESGNTELLVYDLFGRKIYSQLFVDTISDAYGFEINMVNNSSGLYYVVLKTPSISIQKTIQVIR